MRPFNQRYRARRSTRRRSLALEPLEPLTMLSGGAATPTVIVNNGVQDAVVKEDHTIMLPIAAAHGSGAPSEEVLDITVTGISASWGTFSAPVGTYDAVHGTWAVALAPGQTLNTAFTFTPAPNSDADLSNLHATATAYDPVSNTSTLATQDFSVVVDAVADAPTITVQNATGNENSSVAISLSGAVTDTDGSETITGYKISGVPTGFTFNHGTNAGSGVWTFTPTNITGLTLTPASNFTGTLNLTATVLNAETNLSGQEVDFTDNTNSASTNFTITVRRTTTFQTAQPLGPASSSNTAFFAVGNILFYSLNGQLWKTDGTVAGTVMVKDINPSSSLYTNNYSHSAAAINGTLFFDADDGVHGIELWKSDGTTAGTVLVADITPGTSGPGPQDLTVVNGTLFFSADDSVHGRELWKSDGTTAGTIMVKDITSNTAYGGSYPRFMANVNGTLFFVANDTGQQANLWKSDGTAAGTVLVKNLQTNLSGNNYPSNLVNVNGTLFFDTLNYNNDLLTIWKSDGSTTGTVQVQSIPDTGYLFPYAPRASIAANGLLFFAVETDPQGTQLWRTDGTAAGTVQLTNFFDPSRSGQFALFDLSVFDGKVFFLNESGFFGANMYVSDGTVAGTQPFVGDSQFSTASSLAVVGNKLYFDARDPTAGDQLWSTDGTLGGTVKVTQIPSAFSNYNAYLSNLANVNGRLFFTADDGVDGPRWYVLTTETVPTGDFNNDGHVDVRDLQPAMQALANPDSYAATYGVPVSSLSTVGDVNGDGNFNNLDLQALLNLLLSGAGSTSPESSKTESSSINNESLAPPATAGDTAALASALPTDTTTANSPSAGTVDTTPATNSPLVSLAPPSPTLAPPATALVSETTPNATTRALTSAPTTDTVVSSSAPTSFHDIPGLPQSDSIGNFIFIEQAPGSAAVTLNASPTSPQHLQLAAIDWALQSATDYRTRHLRWHDDAPPTETNLSSDDLLPTSNRAQATGVA